MNDERNESEEANYPRCGSTRHDGSGLLCGNGAGKGTDHYGFGHCEFHGGNSPSGKKHAAKLKALAEMSQMGEEIDIDPQTALFNSVRRAYGIVQWLALQVETAENPVESPYFTHYQAERKQLAQICKMALDAGLDERMVKIAELQMRQMAEFMRRVFSDEEVQLTPEQRLVIPGVVRRHMAALGAG